MRRALHSLGQEIQILREEEDGFLYPTTNAYNETVDAMIQRNGGRDNVETIKMWALNVGEGSTTWGFFSPCTTATKKFTTSMVGTNRDCNQFPAIGKDKPSSIAEVTASGSYMLLRPAYHLRLQVTFAV